MEPFEIITENGDKFIATPNDNRGKIFYTVKIGEHEVAFTGNPNWDKGGACLVYEDAPAELDISLLEDIAAAIERRTF